MLPFLMISILLAPTTLSAKASFAQFLETLRNDAENQGIRTTTLALALNDLESDPQSWPGTTINPRKSSPSRPISLGEYHQTELRRVA